MILGWNMRGWLRVYATIFNKGADRRGEGGRRIGGEPDMVMVKYEEYERVGDGLEDGIGSGE